MNDDQAGTLLEAVLELAVTVRDEVGPAVTEAARAVLAAAHGDPVAALVAAAVLVQTDAPIDTWWQPEPGRLLKPCGTHTAFTRHVRRGEDIDPACQRAEITYQRDRYRKRPGPSGKEQVA